MESINKIKLLFKKVFLLRYIPNINKEINIIKDDLNVIRKYKSSVNETVTLIPDKYIDDIKSELKTTVNNLSKDNPLLFKEGFTAVSSLDQNEKPKKMILMELEYQGLEKRFFTELEELEEEIKKTNHILGYHYEAIKNFKKDIEKLKKQYIAHSDLVKIKEEYQSTYLYFVKKSAEIDEVKEFKAAFPSLEESAKLWNKEFISNEMAANREFFDNIDGKSLDDQQREAVIVDEEANLVVAGAGSGKTLTISGKVKYLVEKKGVNPKDILLISFTRKAADEMEERIKQRLRIDVDVKTFHKLGRRIIGRYTQNAPDIADSPQEIIKGYFDNEMYDDPIQLKRMIEYFGYYLNIPKDLEEFNSLGESFDHQKSVDLQTLKSKYEEANFVNQNTEKLKQQKITLQGEKVKSIEEVMIANFLFLNGIEYIYESEYKYSTGDEFYRRYKPDYYLPDYDIYIEHFGITKEGRTPWLSEVEEQKYIDGMEWKRTLHEENNTTLIETYSYLTKDGKLLETLRKKLIGNKVVFKEVDFIDIFDKIYNSTNKNHFNEFIRFVSTFISLFKSNGYTIEAFDRLMMNINEKNIFFQNRTKLFLEIVKPVFDYYESALNRMKLIDFNDMINNAADIINSGNVNLKYKYIIIDEYQDISVSRYQLIDEIRKRTNAKIMCVGDDWQSIYRFAGSDLNLFTQFESYFGFSEMLRIEQTYRNSQKLINFAGSFVLKNEKQIKKNLVSNNVNEEPLQIFMYTGKTEIFKALKEIIQKIVNDFGESTDIMLLGRNNFDVNFIKEDKEFKLIKSKDSVTVVYKKYPKLNIFYLTAHRSKGLEAENVVLINASGSLLGFPNKIADDPILSLVLTEQDEFEFAEERRLFYVAITRTKNVTYILAPDKKMSIFVKEIIKEFGIEPKLIEGNTSVMENPTCPRCLEGSLVIRMKAEGRSEFLGCSNFPLCDYTINDTKILNDKIVCPSCNGYMVSRKGKRGPFYGCSNFPRCRYTIDNINNDSFDTLS